MYKFRSLIPVRVNLGGQVSTVQNVFPARVASLAPAKIPMNASATQNIKVGEGGIVLNPITITFFVILVVRVKCVVEF